MRLTSILILSGCLVATGCSNEANEASNPGPIIAATTPDSGTGGANAGGGASGGAVNVAAPNPEAAVGVPVPIESGVALLGPENTAITFVATHVGAEPNPRTGGFEKFSGKVQVDSATQRVTAMSVEIDTASLWTQIDRLTIHLKSVDLFDVREHPTAKFESTTVTARDGDAGRYDVTGNLTLLGTTKPVSFPVGVKITDQGLTLTGSFRIDRTDFGMDFRPQQVENEVALGVAIGQKTQRTRAPGGSGGGRRGGGRRGAGRFDPSQMFSQRDKNKDG